MTAEKPRRRPLIHHPAVFNRWVSGRRTIYLDNNIWIDLSDGKTREALRCRMLCKQAVDGGGAVFPLSSAAINELLDQPTAAAPGQQAQLMDELSLGVCLRASWQVWRYEARSALDVYPGTGVALPDPRGVFTHVFEYLSDCDLTFQKEWAENDISKFMESSRDHLSNNGVRWLLEHLPLKQMCKTHKKATARYVDELSQRIAESSEHFRSADGRPKRDRILLEEQLWAYRRIIQPALDTEAFRRWGAEGALRFFPASSERHGEGSKKRLRTLMLSMPALALFCELMAARVMDPKRKVRHGDLMDNIHGSIAPAYCDYFVTEDANLRHLLEDRCTVPKRCGCKVLNSVTALAKVISH